MRMTPCESTPRRLAHTTASAQVAAMAGSTPAAAKIAAAKRVRSAFFRRTSSLMRDGSSRATRGGRGGPPLLRLDAGDAHRLGDARGLVLQRPRIVFGSGAHRLGAGGRELTDDLGLLHDRDRHR